MLDLRTTAFHDYSTPGTEGIPTIIDAPYAGHSAVIATITRAKAWSKRCSATVSIVCS